jgi:hypothetical protein
MYVCMHTLVSFLFACLFTWYVTNLFLTFGVDCKGEMECMCKERVLGSFEMLLRYLPRGRFTEETHEKPQNA